MKITRVIEAEVTFDVSFPEACKVVLHQMSHDTCDDFEKIVDKVILDFELKKSNPSGLMVDEMKDVVLEKMKNEFSLEKIEQLYDYYRKTSSIPS